MMAGIGGRRLKDRGKPCPYCGQPMTATGKHRVSPDHLLARSKGGRLGLNLLYVGHSCNQDKRAMSLEQFAAMLEAKGDKRAARVRDLVKRSRQIIHADFDPTR